MTGYPSNCPVGAGAAFAISCLSKSSGEGTKTFKLRVDYRLDISGATQGFSWFRELMTVVAMSVVLPAASTSSL